MWIRKRFVAWPLSVVIEQRERLRHREEHLAHRDQGGRGRSRILFREAVIRPTLKEPWWS
jgi:hypothetical protein